MNQTVKFILITKKCLFKISFDFIFISWLSFARKWVEVARTLFWKIILTVSGWWTDIVNTVSDTDTDTVQLQGSKLCASVYQLSSECLRSALSRYNDWVNGLLEFYLLTSFSSPHSYLFYCTTLCLMAWLSLIISLFTGWFVPGCVNKTRRISKILLGNRTHDNNINLDGLIDTQQLT